MKVHDDDLVITYSEWQEDPLNEGRPINEYMDEVVMRHDTDEDILLWCIRELQRLYLDPAIKKSPEKQKLVKSWIEQLKNPPGATGESLKRSDTRKQE